MNPVSKKSAFVLAALAVAALAAASYGAYLTRFLLWCLIFRQYKALSP